MTGSPGQTRPLMCINIMSSRWAQMCHLIFFQTLVCTGSYWVSREQYLLILGGTGSVLGSTDWYWLVLGATGSVYCVLRQNRTIVVASVMWFQKIYGLHAVNHQIFREGKSDDGQTNGQTDRQNFLSKTRPLLWKGSSKKKRPLNGKGNNCQAYKNTKGHLI